MAPATTFSFIASAWAYVRKQPVLLQLVLWVIALPLLLTDILLLVRPADPTLALAMQIALFIVITFTSYWGAAGVLLVGKRMIQKNKAGRSRTSVKAILQDSAPLVLPLFFTSILRTCFTLYRLLLLIPLAIVILFFCEEVIEAVHSAADIQLLIRSCPLLLLAIPLALPAAMYQLRTAFYQVALVEEGTTYREAMHRSTEITRGRFWHVAGTLLLLAIILFAIPFGLALAYPLVNSDLKTLTPLLVISMAIAHATSVIAGLLFTLSLIAFYGQLRKEHFALAAREATTR
jgi:hypothetical protein